MSLKFVQIIQLLRKLPEFQISGVGFHRISLEQGCLSTFRKVFTSPKTKLFIKWNKILCTALIPRVERGE